MRVGVALEEALRNALYHGNLEVDSSLREGDERAFFALVHERASQPPFRMRRIDVIAAYDRVQAAYTIRDEGLGFDTSIIDRPIEPESVFAASGRGLLLMRTFMDELRFNALGNEVTMIKHRCPSRGVGLGAAAG
jgi:anti-sigma regulatory factor (Ser/Thr protein kinase)